MKWVISIILILSAIGGSADWQVLDTGVTEHLNGICPISDTNVWVVGTNGTVLNYDGSDWTTVDVGLDKTLNAIAMIDETEGWIVGEEGIILHLYDGVWHQIPDIDEQLAFDDIQFIDAENVYIVGHSFLSGGVIWFWNGTEFSEAFTIGGNIQDLRLAGPDNIWGVGSNGVRVHFDGSSWTQDTTPLPEAPGSDPVNLFGVDIDENGAPFVCGTKFSDGVSYIYSHSAGTGWYIVYRDWEPWLLDICLDETVGIVVGKEGRILENSIFGWHRATSPTTNQINCLKLLDMSRGWAATNYGEVLRYEQPAIDIQLSTDLLEDGTNFDVSYALLNPGPETSMDVFIFLEVYGYYYFWPSWSLDADFDTINLPQESYDSYSLFSFIWPDAGTGTAKFWGAFIKDGQLVNYDIEEFSWQ